MTLIWKKKVEPPLYTSSNFIFYYFQTPRSLRTFDPARPFEGRLARHFTIPQTPQEGYTNPQPDPNYTP